MIILAKAAFPNINMTPNLGAMLLLYLDRQAHQSRGPITCGGVITVLANALVINLDNLAGLSGERRVGLATLRATGMVIKRNN